MDMDKTVWQWRSPGKGLVTATLWIKPQPRNPHSPIPGEMRLCNSVLPRGARGLPPCEDDARWQIETAGRGYTSTGWYCHEDIPDRYIPPAFLEDEDDDGAPDASDASKGGAS